ncbi:hypothetical protein HV097_11540 [Enterobacter roggenkampii]|uniref:hypothetical protein n=1 Tax=Enterobacter roggenkampii TaxID=1812935 RepID=UPI0015EA3A90|nr:hypothetical protein [Enterobacter roggenkampii]QMR81359.1 hypothetical protein HV097_11540 [Enterobacter roggenkampii]
MSEVTDLVVIEKQNAMAVFTTKEQLDPIIEAIEKEARSLVPDVSTRKGRDAIASMAHKVARSKTYIDNAGKDLVAELKALPKQIDESRRIVRERLDALKDEVRKPLTDWENAESARKDALQQRLADLRSLADVIDGVGSYLPSVEIQQRIESAKAVALDESWQEAAAEAGVAKDATIQQLESALIVAKQREHEAAELERLRKEAEEKARLEREENIRREAAERARRDAEAKHKAEIEAAARREAEEKARAELAEREKAAAVEAERLKARQAEEKRLAEEKRIADEQAKREADVKHRKTVGTNIVNALTSHTSLTREQAIEVLTALKDDLIPCAKIHY